MTVGGCLKLVGAITVIVIGLAFVGSLSRTGSTGGGVIEGSNNPVAPAPTAGPQLALLSSTCTAEYGYDTCEGAVQNISSSSMRNVEAVVTWFDANGTPQRTDEALISYNPVLAGQTSPWKTIGTHNPGLTKYRVAFKELLGGTISTRDDRK